MNIVQQIEEAFPTAQERWEAARALLSEEFPLDVDVMSHYMTTLGVTLCQAAIIDALVRRAGVGMPRRMIEAAAERSGSYPREFRDATSYIKRIRKHGVRIETMYGLGYMITKAEAERIGPPRP